MFIRSLNSLIFDWAEANRAAQKLGWHESFYWLLKSTCELFPLEIPEIIWEKLIKDFDDYSVESYIKRLRKKYNFLHAFQSVERGERLRFFFGLYILPSSQYIQETYSVGRDFYLPYYYLKFMINGSGCFFQVRFGRTIGKK